MPEQFQNTNDPADRAPDEPASISGWLAQNGITLAFVAAAVAFAAWKGWDFLLIGKVIVGLGFVVFIHELGHFLAAKWCDVHVETFSIGFGPALPGCSFQRGETRYMVALFPLGGYVKMVGEGAESEEGDDDPRSFKNKAVGQRMLIISAGVIMNVILAAVCYVGVFMTAGVERTAGVVGIVDAGSPAWQEGLRSGSVLLKLGTIDHPYFNIDIMPEVMHWSSSRPMPIEYEYNGKITNVEVVPKQFDTAGRQMIGIGQPYSTRLLAGNRLKLPPYFPNSVAAQAKPPLENGDQIVGTTDPDQPDQVKALPPDPRTTQPGRYDFFEFSRRMQRLAGRDVALRIHRATELDPAKTELTSVPPAFHGKTGLIMQIGPIAAIRRGSPAETAGIRAGSATQVGDILDSVEATNADGTTIRFAATRSAQVKPGVEERILDPLRLPFELRQWAESQKDGAKDLRLTLIRQVGHNERKEVTVSVAWDNSWQFDRSSPTGDTSPEAIDELGLAYQITSRVQNVIPDSPAAKAGVQPGDLIQKVGVFDPTKPIESQDEPVSWKDVKTTQWANWHWLLQVGGDMRKLFVKVQRGNETVQANLDCPVDTTWPLVERGMRFEFDTRLQKADGFAEALSMGARDTIRQISVIYNNLFAMITGKVSFEKNASGPIMIAAVAYEFAGRNFPEFILFLGMISINLAVINFLPIPVLDGGHMAFLLYEKARGRPAPEQLRIAATFVGVALIVSLMVFVTYLDFKRL